MGKRVVALLLALGFFVSTIGFSVLIIVSTRNEESQADELQQAISAAQEQQQTQDELTGDVEVRLLEDFEPRSEEVTELEKIDTVVGTGNTVKEGDVVTVHYTGALVANGQIFESSKDNNGEPITFGLSGLIAGWQEGIPGMKVGGTRRLVIPSAKAYGEQAAGSIPANSDLVFDIELIGIAE